MKLIFKEEEVTRIVETSNVNIIPRKVTRTSTDGVTTTTNLIETEVVFSYVSPCEDTWLYVLSTDQYIEVKDILNNFINSDVLDLRKFKVKHAEYKDAFTKQVITAVHDYEILRPTSEKDKIDDLHYFNFRT